VQRRSAQWKPIAIFYDGDFPNTASHVSQSTCGYSLYKGVLVQWDEDQDTRVLQLIDALPLPAREQLLIIQEHEGCVAFVWDYQVPEGFEENGGIDVAGDSWSITASYAIRGGSEE
jgi:hypothetical protein